MAQTFSSEVLGASYESVLLSNSTQFQNPNTIYPSARNLTRGFICGGGGTGNCQVGSGATDELTDTLTFGVNPVTNVTDTMTINTMDVNGIDQLDQIRLFVRSTPPPQPGHLTAFWDVQDSEIWSDASNWTTELFPDNGNGGATYTVRVEKGPRIELVNQSATIDALYLSASGELDILHNGMLTVAEGVIDIDGPQGVADGGNIRLLGAPFNQSARLRIDGNATISGAIQLHSGPVFDSQRLRIDGEVTVGGDGEIVVSSSGNNEIKAVNADASLSLVDGQKFLVTEGSYVNVEVGLANQATMALDGTVQATSLENQGRLDIGNAGSLIVADTFTQTSGHTNVAGVLAGGSSLVRFESGTWGGDGLVTGTMINNTIGGPGNSIGRLSVQGSYDQLIGGILQVELESSPTGTKHDQLDVAGEATLGGTLEVSFLGANGPLPDATDIDFLVAADGIVGQFDEVASGTPGIVGNFEVTYEHDRVLLNVTDTFRLGDFNVDDRWTVADLDLMTAALAAETADAAFDLNADGLVNGNDLSELLTFVQTVPGDINLDGAVDFEDFLTFANHYGQEGVWSQGDLDGSGDVQFADFVLLANYFGGSNLQAVAVPEPTGLLLVGLAAGFDVLRRKTAT